MLNMSRMNISARRSCLPEFEPEELLRCIQRLVQIDQSWVPNAVSSSLYIRPTMIGTEPTLGIGPSSEVELFVILSPVGPYFSSGFEPVNLLADPNFVRSWPGGSGYSKMGSNYAPTIYVGVSLDALSWNWLVNLMSLKFMNENLLSKTYLMAPKMEHSLRCLVQAPLPI